MSITKKLEDWLERSWNRKSKNDSLDPYDMATDHPGHLCVLVDQSLSMNQKWTTVKFKDEANKDIEKHYTKMDQAIVCLNDCFDAILKNTYRGPNDYAERMKVTFIGYSTVDVNSSQTVLEEFTVWPNDLRQKKKTIEAHARGNTPMAEAFQRAYVILHEWIKSDARTAAFPPIVINITDGEADDAKVYVQDGVKRELTGELTYQAVERLRTLETAKGQVMIFNAFISPDATKELVFPTHEKELDHLYSGDNEEERVKSRRLGKFLLSLSDLIPDKLRKRAIEEGLQCKNGSYGLIVNAQPSTIVKMVKFGSVTKPQAPSTGTPG